MSTTVTTLSQRQINTLRREAAEAGDLKMVAICDRATDGSERARREVVKAIRAAEAMGWTVAEAVKAARTTSPTDAEILSARAAVWGDELPPSRSARASAIKDCRAMLAATTLQEAASLTMWWLDETSQEARERHVALVEEFRGRFLSA